MLCTIDMCLANKHYTSQQEQALITTRLKNVTTEVDNHGAVTKAVGYLENYRITVLPDKIYFNGSLSKFCLGSNIVSIQKTQILDTIKSIRKMSGLAIQYAKIIRMDIAVNAFLKERYPLYIPYFEETYGYLKGKDAHKGIKYSNVKGDEIEFAIYNKLEAVRKQEPDIYPMVKQTMDKNGDKGVMRLELRIKKGARKLLLPNAKYLMVVHLLSRRMQCRLISLFYKHYKAIAKTTTTKLPMKDIVPAKITKILAARQLQKTGELAAVLTCIDTIAMKNNWSAKKKSTTKTTIKELHGMKISEESSHYIRELDDKVLNNEELVQWKEDWQ